MNKRIKIFMLAAGGTILLAGCTKSNIVSPDAAELKPDFERYANIEIDTDQIYNNLDMLFLNSEEYPMAAGMDFELNMGNDEEGYVDITAVVKDDTTPEDAAIYAEALIKAVNDEVAMQDFNYGESGEDTFGGIYQDNEIRLKIYTESQYGENGDGEVMYEVTIPADLYVYIVIE